MIVQQYHSSIVYETLGGVCSPILACHLFLDMEVDLWVDVRFYFGYTLHVYVQKQPIKTTDSNMASIHE